jgi:phosphoenolpyruvate carboxylase
VSEQTTQFQADDAGLRADVRRLTELLGESLVRQEGSQLVDLVEKVRKAVREGGGEEILENISVDESVQLVRAFSNYFNLANVAEQVHRARILSDERNSGGSWLTRAVDRIIEVQAEMPTKLNSRDQKPSITCCYSKTGAILRMNSKRAPSTVSRGMS